MGRRGSATRLSQIQNRIRPILPHPQRRLRHEPSAATRSLGHCLRRHGNTESTEGVLGHCPANHLPSLQRPIPCPPCFRGQRSVPMEKPSQPASSLGHCLRRYGSGEKGRVTFTWLNAMNDKPSAPSPSSSAVCLPCSPCFRGLAESFMQLTSGRLRRSTGAGRPRRFELESAQ